MELNQIPQNPNNWGNVADLLNENSGKIEAETAKLNNATTKFKGYFSTSTALSAKYPSPLVGDTAWVGATYPGVVYRCNVAGAWLATTDVPPSNTVNLSEYATQDAVSNEFASVRSDLSEGVAAKKDSFPFVTNLGLSILTSFKDIKIYGYESKDVQYIQLLYFFNNRPSNHQNSITITIKALDGTSKSIDASLGNSVWNQQHGIHQYNFVDGTTVIGYVVVDWDVAPVSEFYGNTTTLLVILSSACFIDKKIIVDSIPTANSNNAVSSGGTFAAIEIVKDGIINNVSPFTTVAEPLVNVVTKIGISVGKIEHLAYKYALVRFYNMEGYKTGSIERISPDGTTERANFDVVDGQVSDVLYFGALTDSNHVSWLNIYIDLDQFAVTSWDGTMYIKSENVHLKYDSVPTDNSENLVVSGGVKSYVDGKDNSNSVFFKTDGYNYTEAGSDMPLMVKSIEITDKDYFDGYIWPQYIFNYSPQTTPPRSNFILNHTSEDGQTTTSIVVEGADYGGYDINHQGIITHNLLVGETVIGKIIIDWDLYKGLEFYGNQTTHLLKVKRSCYKIVGSQGITKVNDYSVKDDTKRIIKVDILGNGDYTTIKAACESINNSAYDNQYEIVVFPGIYYENDIHVPAYTHIHGLAPNTVVVSSKQQEGQTTLPVFDQEYASSKLSNMRIDSHTGYCIHYDRGLDGCSIRNENLYLFRDSLSSGNITGGGSFKDGTLYEWIGCTFDGRASNYGGSAACHTNVNANYENLHLIYRNCKFINSALRVGSVGGFGHCILEVYNCVGVDSTLGCWISHNLRSLDEPWSYIVPNYEWQVLGGKNKGMAVDATSIAEALQVIANTRVEGQTIKLGGTALPNIFGPIIRYSKGGDSVLAANAIGIYRVEDKQAGTPGYSEQRDVYQLWKRLGNCSVTNKTLTVQIDYGAVQTYTFNKDYLTTKDSETDILAATNAVLTGCTIQKYVSGQVDGWQNVNLIEKIQVTAATDIRFGRWITKNGGIATSSTPAEDILGIAVSNTPKGEYVDVWIGDSWYSYGALEVGANYGSSDYGEIVKNATITLAVAKTQYVLERL